MSPSASSPSEAEFQAQVIELAELFRWKVHHHHDSRREVGGRLVGDKQAKGFPDLVLVRRERVVYAELKAERGLVKPEQQEWLDALAGTGAEVFVWRPREFEEIHATLR